MEESNSVVPPFDFAQGYTPAPGNLPKPDFFRQNRAAPRMPKCTDKRVLSCYTGEQKCLEENLQATWTPAN